jgi:hypothetical protein
MIRNSVEADFQPLTASDLTGLQSRWISEEYARLARLARVDFTTGADLIRGNGNKNYQGISIPNCWPGQNYPREYRLRRDYPDIVDEGGVKKKKNKYLSPPRRGNLLYFVPGTNADWLKDQCLPVLITEGEFKTIASYRLSYWGLGDAAERPRFLPIGLAGVWCWLGSTGKEVGADGKRIDATGPIADLNEVVWKNRQTTIWFDTNVISNDKVRLARWRLTKELHRRGAVVLWIIWPEDIPASVNGVDDYIFLVGPDRALELYCQAKPAKLTAAQQAECPRDFTAVGENRYRMSVPSIGVAFEIDRLRRDRHELVGELSVCCDLPGARTVNGVISTADFNVSSARARTERAKLLSDRVRASELDWLSLVEEFCQRVLSAQRAGQPAIDLRDLERPKPDDSLRVEGICLPRRHPTIIFGDGGAAKSYTALYLAGRLAQQGMSIGLFDWELAGEDHRDRFERLFGQEMPRIWYAHCERGLIYEVDRLRRIVAEQHLDFCIYDSVAFACDGPPESAEVASGYFRAVRQIGGGSLHIAHISRGEGNDQKPFGSAFWHNGARSTWFAKCTEGALDGGTIHLGLFNRKANLGRLSQPTGFQIRFADDRTIFERKNPADNPELAVQLSIRQRMAYQLKGGAMTPEALAEQIDAEVDTVKRTARRYKDLFKILDGGKLSLLERRAS